MITSRAFYTNLELVGYENITIIGTMSAVNTISSRFTSKLHVYNIGLPEDEDLSVIIIAYLTGVIKSFVAWPKTKIAKLSSTLIEIYKQITSVFTTTEQRHYEFSPHDLTRWCSSMIRYKPSEHDDQSLLELFAYEAWKRFGDKLVNEEDLSKLCRIIDESFKSQWNIPGITARIRNAYFVPSAQYSATNFGEELPLQKLNREEWESQVAKGRVQYEREGESLDIVINCEILDMSASLARVLSAFQGHAVLVGKAGVGRKSSLKIVSALQTSRIITPDEHQFSNDLKIALQLSGLEGEQVYLLIEDHLLAKVEVLVAINMLISSGEVPGIYS